MIGLIINPFLLGSTRTVMAIQSEIRLILIVGTMVTLMTTGTTNPIVPPTVKDTGKSALVPRTTIGLLTNSRTA